jgi:DNA-directed RNA polymerase specialized sigma24 family protein
MVDSAGDATRMLARLRGGDHGAADELLPLVYEELCRLASRYMRGQAPGHTLQTTALVHEAYLRLDHARGRRAVKRGGGRQRIPLDEALELFESHSVDLLALDEALGQLAEIDERQRRIVELRFFGGLTAEETAEALTLSTRTVERDWRHARAWLYHALASGTTGDQSGAHR